MSSSSDATKRDKVIADLNRHIFVFVFNENAEPAAAQRLTDAYDQLKSLDIPANWHQTTESLPSQDANFPVVFVMEPFGTAFFQEIKQDYRIISPMCLITCLKETVKIPISSCRCLANLALRDCIVSSSCFSREEVAEIERRVKLMGGLYSGNLMNNTTHLITEEVHSHKYSSACNIRIPVVLRSWLDEAWTLSSSNPKFVALNRPFTKRHRCPVFRKCNVVVTAFIGDERDDVISLLQSNGANYSANIAVEGEHQTTHLIAKRSGTQKYASAAYSCLRIVTKDWVTDSIEEGYRLPECEYQFATTATTSASRSGSSESEALTDALNQLELEETRCDPILDGYRVYLCGFSESQMQRAKRILNLCKATRLSRLSCDVTHIVLGCPTPEQCSKVAGFSPAPSYILRYHWLVECCKQRAAVPESEYLVILSDSSGGAESSKAKSTGVRQRGENQSSGNSELFSQYTKEEKILSNFNFLLIDPEPSLVDVTKQLILNNGGNLVTKESSSLANYTIVPVDFGDQLDITTRMVTLYWLECSLFVKRLLPLDKHPLYAPAQDYGCKDVLSGLVVSVLMGRDNYVECVCVIQLVRYMGARNSLQLKRTNPDRTELVITDDTNQEAVRLAKEWNIPVVKLDWVYSCAMKKDRLPFNSYLHSPSSQSVVDAPIRSPVLFTPDKSKIVVLGPTFELEDAEIYFPHGTTPQVRNPNKPRSVNSQLAEMYTSNLESLTIRDFAAKSDAPPTTSYLNISKVPISDVLKGTSIAFASSFTPQELNQMTNLVTELSGTSCPYSSQVTHYIYVGKHSSWSKEAMLAKKENKYVVHPQWLTDAKKLGKRLDEINYPPSFNPNNSIGYFKIEKLPEPERRNIPEPMDTSQSSELIRHSSSKSSILTDDSTDDKSSLAITIEDIVDTSAFQELAQPQQQQQVASASRKRMRKSSIPTEGIPDPFDVNLPHVNPPPRKSTSPRFKVNLSTQEVYDNFDNQSRDLEEAELSPIDPQSLQGRWKITDSINEFRIPKELRRLSSPYQQKRYLIQNYHDLQESRERVGWDPLPYLDDSPPQMPSSDPPANTVPTVSDPGQAPDIPNLDTVPSRDSARKLRSSSSVLSTSVRATDSPSSSSQSQGYFFVFSNISSDNKIKMGEIISRLGGKHSYSTSYDFKCTHMICGEIASYEKLFCGMAAGVYVLRPEYIDRCQEENQFVCEEPFEWGNQSANLSELTYSKRALATLQWRKKIEDRSQISQSVCTRRRARSGAFEDWVAYFACKGCKIKECRSEIYSQIILAGKGKTTYSLNKRSDITIALFDNHCIQDALLKQLEHLRIPAVNGSYIFEFLDSGGDELNKNKYIISMEPTHS